MPDDPVDAEKRALRAELRVRRRTRTATERTDADAAITEHLTQLATRLGARSVCAYLSTPDEPPTRGFLRWTAEQGIRVLLPISRDDGLLDWAPYDADTEERPDLLGMPTPSTELVAPMEIDAVDLILVPAASVGRDGMRMGWGRGYFDKTLGSMLGCPPVYAVIFDDELVERVPSEDHDVPVDGVVTPGGVIELRP